MKIKSITERIQNYNQGMGEISQEFKQHFGSETHKN
jgi:hypothetical protein